MGTIKVTDPLFAKAISTISADNSLFFTPKQLFYFLDRRVERKANVPGVALAWCIIVTVILSIISTSVGLGTPILGAIGILLLILLSWTGSNSKTIRPQARRIYARYLQVAGGLIIVFGILCSLGLSSVPFVGFFVFLVSIAIGLSSIYYGTQKLAHQMEISQSHSLAASDFYRWLTRWRLMNGSVVKMLPSPNEEHTATEISPEISAYSFDRVVVCDSSEIAQLLIANNFHFENNCAVLSITGYPKSIFNTVLDMLRRNPELKVYALHDASPRGVSLVHHLRTSSNWFQNSSVTIYDLGLSPRQILASRSMFILSSNESAQQAKQMPTQVRQDLSAEEVKWLEFGNFVELESFSPQRLMQVVTQGIAKSRDPNSTDSLVAVDSVGSDVYIFAGDSFG
jgi:hypothetical protein